VEALERGRAIARLKLRRGDFCHDSEPGLGELAFEGWVVCGQELGGPACARDVARSRLSPRDPVENHFLLGAAVTLGLSPARRPISSTMTHKPNAFKSPLSRSFINHSVPAKLPTSASARRTVSMVFDF
jgi:hypothetical protein